MEKTAKIISVQTLQKTSAHHGRFIRNIEGHYISMHKDGVLIKKDDTRTILVPFSNIQEIEFEDDDG